ncbi:MAG: hypothetical protein QXP77_01780 [Candidatus Aenigmatarchaeota archaeon]
MKTAKIMEKMIEKIKLNPKTEQRIREKAKWFMGFIAIYPEEYLNITRLNFFMLTKLMSKVTKYLLDKNLDTLIKKYTKNLDEISLKEQIIIAETVLNSSEFSRVINQYNKNEIYISCKALKDLTIGVLDENKKEYSIQFLEIPICKGEKWFKDEKLIYLCVNRNYNNLLIFANLPIVYENTEAEPYMCDKLRGTNFKPMLLPDLLKSYKVGSLK